MTTNKFTKLFVCIIALTGLSACGSESAEPLGKGGPDKNVATMVISDTKKDVRKSLAPSDALDVIETLENSYLRYLPKEVGVKRYFYSLKYHFYVGGYVAVDLSNDTLERRLMVKRTDNGFETAALLEPLGTGEFSLIEGEDLFLSDAIATFAITGDGRWIEVSDN